MAEVAQKTEELLSSGNSTTQTYVPKVTASAIGHGEGNVAQRFENARQSREERSRRRSNSERQRRSEQFQREKERALRKQNIEELLASDEEEHSHSKTYIPKFSGKVRGRFEEMAKQKEEGERKRAEEERRRRIERDMAERLLLERELAKKALQDKDDEEKEEAFRVSKGKDEIDANVSLSLAERLILLQSPSTSKESVAGHGGSSSQPGRLMLSFEEQERRRREEEEWKAEEEARHRIEEERRSFVEARRSLATEEEGEAEEEEKYGVGLPDVVPSQRLDLDFEELLRRRIEVEQQRAEQERQVRMEEERKVMEEQKLLMEPDVVNESYEVRSREQDEIRKLSRSGTVKAKSLKNKFEKMEQLSEEEVQRKIAQEREKRRAMDEEVQEREVKDLHMAEEEEEVEEPQVVENPSVQRNGMRARILEMERTREAEEQRRIEEQKLLRMQFEQQEIDAALQQTIEEEGTTNGVDGAGLKDEALCSGAPWFKQPLKNLQVVDGEPVRLVVRVMAELEPEVTWWFEGELLNDGDDYRYEKRDNGIYSLFLHETFPDDTGEFLCRAENLHGSAASSCLLTIESFLAIHLRLIVIHDVLWFHQSGNLVLSFSQPINIEDFIL
uniref:Ig-like domain-containing protein n=1 Tax=Eptatretus burgeri TaxID=7764 RepID=A0A8C4N660_EPTBU